MQYTLLRLVAVYYCHQHSWHNNIQASKLYKAEYNSTYNLFVTDVKDCTSDQTWYFHINAPVTYGKTDNMNTISEQLILFHPFVVFVLV